MAETIISGFKNFKAERMGGDRWDITYRKSNMLIGTVGFVKAALNWYFIPVANKSFNGEQLLDIAGLCKTISRTETCTIPEITPLEERTALYDYIKTHWALVHHDEIINGKREGYRWKAGNQLYVILRIHDNTITAINFYRKKDFQGSLSIKIVRKELARIKNIE